MAIGAREFRSVLVLPLLVWAACEEKPAPPPAAPVINLPIATQLPSVNSSALMPTPAPKPPEAPLLLPPAMGRPAQHPDLADVMEKASHFRIFLGLVKEAGAESYLHVEGQLTVLAPTDEAFGKFPAAQLAELKKDKVKVTAWLLQHVITGADLSTVRLFAVPSLRPARGAPLTIERRGSVKTVNGARIVLPDLNATNGVIHGIDKALVM